jgi:hypothetical protein
MVLQPEILVSAFALRNSTALSLIHGQFADLVPQVFGELENRHPDGRIHGGVFSANVRDAFLVALENDGLRVDQLLATERQFRSVRFRDQEGWTCRVHMHPRDLRSGSYLPTTPPPEPLFGAPVLDESCELAILWRPSTKQKALRSISLAAVAGLAERSRTVIYASTPLPPISMGQYWQPTTTNHSQSIDDFDDYFADGEDFGDDPA